MRPLLIIFSIITIASACGNNEKQQQATQAAAAQAKQATIDSVAAASQKQKTIDSLKVMVARDSAAKVQTAQRQPVAVTKPATTTQTPSHKKGWNSTTKGAVIGGGAGAVTGALVSKGKLGGAVVGGILGASAGAGTGAIIDHSKKKKEQKKLSHRDSL